MVTVALMIILVMLVDFGSSTNISYNQPKFSPCASWNITEITYNINTVGGQPDGIFVDTNNMVYVASMTNKCVIVWREDNTNVTRTICNSSDTPISVFVSTNGDIFVGLDSSTSSVDKYTSNATSPETLMHVGNGCHGLFIDLNNTIYCSMENGNQVVKNSLNSNGASSSRAAGNGSNGAGSFMLSGPRGIFVDNEFNLYVADRYNNRIQLFSFDQLNGSTIVGTGAIGAAGNFSLNQPTDVILDGDNHLFIVDSNNSRIVGSGPFGYRCLIGCSSSGGTSTSPLSNPRTLSFDTYGNMFVSDKYINQVHKFLLSTNYCNSTQSTQYIDTTAVTTTLIVKETTNTISTHSTQMKTTMIPKNINITSTEPSPLPNFIPVACNDSDHIGTTCNISNTPCDVLKPCQNQGICINNKSVSNVYVCYCPSGFNGSECQFDIRPCKSNTCWNNGTCVNTSNSEFICKCAEGWTGIHCEIKVDYCQNITCQNNGVCRPLFQDYQCECSSSSYSGRHCEITASTLITRKILSKSFGYIAIIFILIVVGFIVLLDALKYIFRIELEPIRRRKAPKKKKKSGIPMHFTYVHESSSQVPPTSISIVEETTV